MKTIGGSRKNYQLPQSEFLLQRFLYFNLVSRIEQITVSCQCLNNFLLRYSLHYCIQKAVFYNNIQLYKNLDLKTLICISDSFDDNKQASPSYTILCKNKHLYLIIILLGNILSYTLILKLFYFICEVADVMEDNGQLSMVIKVLQKNYQQ